MGYAYLRWPKTKGRKQPPRPSNEISSTGVPSWKIPIGLLGNELTVLDRARRGYLGFPLSKKRLGRGLGKQTFYFNGHAMKRVVLKC